MGGFGKDREHLEKSSDLRLCNSAFCIPTFVQDEVNNAADDKKDGGGGINNKINSQRIIRYYSNMDYGRNCEDENENDTKNVKNQCDIGNH